MDADAESRQASRMLRSAEPPILSDLPDIPGIGLAMSLAPELEVALRTLADVLLVNDFPGATLTRPEREMIATSVSAVNDCFFCMDSHGAFAASLLRRQGAADAEALVETLKSGGLERLSAKMQGLLAIARTVARDARGLKHGDTAPAMAAGATSGDIQLAVLIASAFSMYNRMVEGLRAPTAAEASAYAERAEQIADLGYVAQPEETEPAATP